MVRREDREYMGRYLRSRRWRFERIDMPRRYYDFLGLALGGEKGEDGRSFRPPLFTSEYPRMEYYTHIQRVMEDNKQHYGRLRLDDAATR